MKLLPTTTSESIDMPIRVVLAGNECVTRAGLRMLLDGHCGIRVIAETGCTGHLDAVWAGPQAHIVLLDLDCAGSVEFIPRVRESGRSSTRIIVLTRTPDSAACATAVERGVLGVVSKQQPPEVLIKAIQRVHAGEVWLNRSRIAGLIGALRSAPEVAVPPAPAVPRPSAVPPASHDRYDTLLPRERQIVTLVAQGFRNNEIADSLLVSEATVRNCLGSIFKKLGISNRVHLLIYAIQEGFVSRPATGNPSTAAPRRDVLRLATRAGEPIRDPNQS